MLVVDDGSTDGTPDRLAARQDIKSIRHAENRGYGAALKSAFDYAIHFHYDVLVTIDCDGQHEPQRIRRAGRRLSRRRHRLRQPLFGSERRQERGSRRAPPDQ